MCCGKRQRDSTSSGCHRRVSSLTGCQSFAAHTCCRHPAKRRNATGGSSANTARRRHGKPASLTRSQDLPDCPRFDRRPTTKTFDWKGEKVMFVRFDEGYPSSSPLEEQGHRFVDLMPAPAPPTAVAVIETIATGAPT